MGLPQVCLAKPRSEHKQQSIRAKTLQNPSTQPKPKTLRRLGRTSARNPRRRLCKESNSRNVSAMVFISSTNVKEHAPPLARASVGRGVRVEVTQEHVNRAASGGCCVSSCSLLLFLLWCRNNSCSNNDLSREIGHLAKPDRPPVSNLQYAPILLPFFRDYQCRSWVIALHICLF